MLQEGFHHSWSDAIIIDMVQRRSSSLRGSRDKPYTKAQLLEAVRELGVVGATVVDPATVETAEWVRWKCQFGCGGFGSSLVCPPRSPAPAQTRLLLKGYRRAVLFEAPPGKPKKIAVALERRLFLAGHYKALGLGEGPCSLCEHCAMDEGCRHPHQARPSMEACGIDVFATARKHGFSIDVVRDDTDKQHYFGLVLVD